MYSFALSLELVIQPTEVSRPANFPVVEVGNRVLALQHLLPKTLDLLRVQFGSDPAPLGK